MTQPDAVGSRSLEEILASIRKSLAEDSVDGLVELSAPAVAAVRAEVKAGGARSPAAKAEPAAAELPSASLTDKLAGALSGTESVPDELADVLEEPVAVQPAPEPAPALGAPVIEAAAPAESSDAAKDPMWFLRPGAPEKPAADARPVPTLKIDPYSPRRPSAEEPKPGAAEPNLAPDPVLETTQEDLPAPATPRLDPERLERINKLRDTIAGVEKAPEPRPVAPRVDLPRETAPKPSVAPATRSDLAPHTGPALVLRTEGPRVPLFGGETDSRRPVVSEPTPLPVPPAPVEARFEEPEPGAHAIAAPAGSELPPVEPEELQVAEAAANLSEPAISPEPQPAFFAQPASGAVVPEHDAVAETAVAPVPEVHPSPASQARPTVPASASNRPLEEMIAAMLEPLIQKLLEKNLASQLEALVQREVEKAMRDAGHR